MQTLRNSFSPVLLALVLLFGLFVAFPALADDNDNDNDYDPEDFTVEVDGEDVSPDSFRGDEDGRTVHLDEGRYDVEIRNDRGYHVSYSSGCEGSIDEGEKERCRITLEDRSFNVYTPPYFAAPAITIQKGYIPAMPSTGFPPLTAAVAAFALAALAIIGFFVYPHARKAFTAVLS